MKTTVQGNVDEWIAWREKMLITIDSELAKSNNTKQRVKLLKDCTGRLEEELRFLQGKDIESTEDDEQPREGGGGRETREDGDPSVK